MIKKINDYTYLNTLSNYIITDNAFNKVLIYQEKDIIMGFIDYSIMYERAEINYIFVKEEYRGKHIASMLMEEFFKEKFNEVTLEVNINNDNAINLYKKFGFEEISRRIGYYNGIDALLMIKRR